MDPATFVKNAICKSVSTRELSEEGWWEVETPFLDWKGEPLTVWVNREGEITDAGALMSELRALRTIDRLAEWSNREQYFTQFNIKEVHGSLKPASSSEPGAVVRYLQGLSRLAGMFGSNPIREGHNRFPSKVKREVKSLLEIRTPTGKKPENWVKERLAPHDMHAALGIEVQSDASPLNPAVMVQYLSHATKESGDREEHVGYRMFQYDLVKQVAPYTQLTVVLPSMAAYPDDAQKMIYRAKPKIIEWAQEEDREEFADILCAAPTNNRVLA